MKSMTLTLLSTPFNRKLFWPFERTPLAENPPPAASRAPGSAGTTAGTVRARNAKRRWPPSGSSLVCRFSRVPPIWVVSVCSAGGVARISIVSVTSPISRMKFVWTRPADCRITPFCTERLNPGDSHEMV